MEGHARGQGQVLFSTRLALLTTFALSLVIRFGASTNSLLIEQIFINSPLNF